jgi:hypothetical protein
MWWLELGAVAILLDLTLIGVAVLLMRATGKRIPYGLGPKWLIDKINGWVDPNPRRFDRLVFAMRR